MYLTVTEVYSLLSKSYFSLNFDLIIIIEISPYNMILPIRQRIAGCKVRAVRSTRPALVMNICSTSTESTILFLYILLNPIVLIIFVIIRRIYNFCMKKTLQLIEFHIWLISVNFVAKTFPFLQSLYFSKIPRIQGLFKKKLDFP